MALPTPTKPTKPALNAPNQTLQRHLPSPAISTIPQQSKPKDTTTITQNDEQKVSPNTDPSPSDIPQIFDTKYNTKEINWNELHYLATIKGRTIYVQQLITTQYSSQLTNYDTTNNNNLPQIPNLCPEILQFIHQILSETSIVLSAHNLLHSHTNWETQVDNHEGISVYYRQEDTENGIHSIKIDYTSTCHPVDLICVINEFDLIKEIVTIVPMETRYLKQFTNLNKVIYSQINMWWPLKNRDAVVHVRAYDLLNEYDEILIWGKSTDKVDGVEIPELQKGTIRMDVTMAEGVIKPKIMENGQLGTEVIASFNVDFKTFLPKTLLNWITRTFAYYVCKMIRHRTENLEGTKHQQRVKENEVYQEWTKEFENWKVRKQSEQKMEKDVEKK